MIGKVLKLVAIYEALVIGTGIKRIYDETKRYDKIRYAVKDVHNKSTQITKSLKERAKVL